MSQEEKKWWKIDEEGELKNLILWMEDEELRELYEEYSWFFFCDFRGKKNDIWFIDR
mgnify:CR=1 FL=1